MNCPYSVWTIAGLLVLLAVLSGCTSTQSATTPAVTPSSPQGGGGTVPATGTTLPAETTSSGIDTAISIHYNDDTCINIPHTMGVEYLNPGEQYTVWVATPGAGTITPNLLVLNYNDYLRFSSMIPVWDSVQKTWTYSGIMPLLQINDVISPQSGTVTVKSQGWYFLCIDDRKENGASSAVYQVPVRVVRD